MPTADTYTCYRKESMASLFIGLYTGTGTILEGSLHHHTVLIRVLNDRQLHVPFRLLYQLH